MMMKPQDHVAVALEYIPAGAVVEVKNQDQTITVQLKDDIEFGHKFCVSPLKAGEDILKYGEVIGVATTDIQLGEHVHVHNLAGKRGRGDMNDQQQS